MSDLLLTVVITVYNQEKYVAACVESVTNQTYKNIDIVVIDDGSTDSSPAICDEYALKDSRIRVVHKSNAGSVSARKVGLNHAKGQYVTYIDGDDYVTPDLYDTAMSFIAGEYEKNAVDIYAYSLTCFYGDGSTQIIRNCQQSGMYLGDSLCKIKSKALYYGKFGHFGLFPSMCSKIFKKEIIEDNLKNVTDGIRMGDDGACTYPAICDSNYIVVNNELEGYMYRQADAGTQTTSYLFDEFYRIEDLFNVLYPAFSKRNAEYMYEQLAYYLAFLYRTEIIQELSHLKVSNFSEKKQHLQIIKDLEWVKYMHEHVKIRNFNKETRILVKYSTNPGKLMFRWYLRRLLR